MLVKCQICGSKIDRDTAYKRIGSSSNKYYCSEEEFKAEEKKKRDEDILKRKIYYSVCEILEVNSTISTILYKEWAEWKKVCTNEEILQYLEDNKTFLEKKMRTIVGKETSRIRYLSAILKNNLTDYKTNIKKKNKKDFTLKTNESFELFEAGGQYVVDKDENVLLEVDEEDLL